MSNIDNFSQYRSAFMESFYRISDDNEVKLCKEWEVPLPVFLPVLAKLYDEKLKRILTVELSDDDQNPFDYAIRRTGLHLEEDDLLIRCRNPIENIYPIFEIYRTWFVEKISSEKMDEMLTVTKKSLKIAGSGKLE